MDVLSLLRERVNRSDDPSSPEYGGVGGSQVAAILGLDDFGKDALDVYHSVTRDPVPADVEVGLDEIDFLRGRVLESPIVDELYLRKYPERRVRRQLQTARHPEYPFAIVHADRMVLADGDRPTGALEVKAPRTPTWDRIRKHGIRHGYVVQLQWTMFVRRWEIGEFAVGNFERGLYVVEQEPSEKVVGRALEAVDRFWHDHVLPRVPPDPRDFRIESIEVPRPSGKVTTVDDPGVAKAFRSFWRARELRDRAEEQEKEARALLEAEMELRGIDRMYVPEVGTVHWTESAGRRTFDRKTLEGHRPIDRDALVRLASEWTVPADLRAAIEAGELDLDLGRFVKQGEPYRSFRPFRE